MNGITLASMRLFWHFLTLCGEGRFFVFNEGIPTVPGDDDALCSSFMKENVAQWVKITKIVLQPQKIRFLCLYK